jgi:hypothetical protein
MPDTLLKCVYEYLRERGVVAELYNGYVEVVRRRKRLNLAFVDGLVLRVGVSEFQACAPRVEYGSVVNGDQVGVGYRDFDISDPNSLQGIYEFVTSKKNK